MAVDDPNITRTTEVRETFTTAPEPATTTTVLVRESATGWWIAGACAVMAIIAVVFIAMRPERTSTEEAVAEATAAGRAEADLANTQMNLNQAMSGQDAANRAAANATMAASDANARADAAMRSASQAAASAANRPTTVIVTPVPAAEPAPPAQ